LVIKTKKREDAGGSDTCFQIFEDVQIKVALAHVSPNYESTTSK
jgi:hypothetical protein